MDIIANRTIGEIVANDYRTAAVFEKYGIDFCCKGNRSLQEACELKRISEEDVKNDLLGLYDSNAGCPMDFRALPASMLADHIEEKHHRYVREKTPVLIRYLEKICSVHGEAHPELFQVLHLFNQASVELAAHMQKEEIVLFPLIRKLDMHEVQMKPMSVKGPIQMMHHEHDVEGDRFRMIEELTNHYLAPEGACNTFKVTYAMLKEFENDLHLHIHLENNLLFPKAIEMEESLMN